MSKLVLRILGFCILLSTVPSQYQIINAQEIKNIVLKCTIDITPKEFYIKEQVEVVYSLKNISQRPVFIAKSIEGSPNFWFRLKIVNTKESILNGLENYSASGLDNLPQTIIDTLNPGEFIKIKTRSNFSTYNLSRGIYSISAVYRVEPGKEPEGANIVIRSRDRKRIWTGVILSEPVTVVIK